MFLGNRISYCARSLAFDQLVFGGDFIQKDVKLLHKASEATVMLTVYGM